MVPGDSLVDKIFEEGIKEAQAVIVVLSNNSVNKPWVREELNAAVVNRINKGSKLIPVVIDDCPVPQALQSTLWQKINDINNYDEELKRILMAIFGYSDRPPIGEAPAYTRTVVDTVPGLTPVDSLVLKLSVEMAIEEEQAQHVNVDKLIEKASSFDVPEDEVIEALEILDQRGYHEQARIIGGGRKYSYFKITTYGFDEYARVYIPDYDSLIMSVASQILNHGKDNNKEINQVLNHPQLIIDFILDVMHNRGWIRVSKRVGGWSIISEIYSEMKRALREDRS